MSSFVTGSDEPPGWFANIKEDPDVEVQVLDEVFPARARMARADEKAELWDQMVGHWPDYDAYQSKTDREIPIVLLERR